MTTGKELKRELHEWKESRLDLFEGEDAWIQELEFDISSLTISMNVDYDFSATFPTVMIMLPDNYPKGNVSVTFAEEFVEYPGSSLLENMETIIADFEKKRHEILEETSPTGVHSEDIFDQTPATGISEPEDEIFEMDDDRVNPTEIIDKDIQALKKIPGYNGLYRGSGVDEIRVYLFFDPKQKLDISELVAAAWGIDLNRWIGIALTFSQHYLEADAIPQIDAFQSGNTSLLQDNTLLDGRTQFGLYWTVQERLKADFFKQWWPFSKYEAEQHRTGKTYMQAVLEAVEDIIKKSPGNCIICGKPLPFEGLKPTVCDSSLCVFSHEEYGLGVDLESAIKKNPEIVDLSITMTCAASQADTSRFNPFNPFPLGLEVKLNNREKGIVETFNFLNEKGERDNYKVKAVLEKIPDIKKLSAWVDEGKLKDRCDELDPLLYSLLRWILASNRSHLKQLDPEEQIKEMNTKYQYCLVSSPPAREKEFQELKKQYGSVYAFHGSALGNWHSIMRQGLKNMSGTSGMVNGAVYGDGVYLAPESGTSFGYMRYTPGWKNSLYNSSTLGCMAVCEIIKHPSLSGQPNPYYVVPNESWLATRYFLMYTTQTNVGVDGATLNPPKLKLN